MYILQKRRYAMNTHTDSRVLEKFLKYIKINTRSSAGSDTVPSTPGQLELAGILCNELKEAGAENVLMTEKGYVYGFLPATAGLENVPVFGFIAHMDTSDAASGENIKPDIIRYDGTPVPLGTSGKILSETLFPDLAELRGDTLVVTDGTTLLGADDKGGCAEIITALEKIVKENIPHGPLAFAFTPDEEIGCGMDHFEVEKFGAAFAFTLDGGKVNLYEYENFNAAGATILFHGLPVHPGSAKGKMINALSLAWEFHSLLPAEEVPEKTENYEGFYFLHELSGSSSEAKAQYLLRDHDQKKFEARKAKIREITLLLQEKYGRNSLEAILADQYENMAEVMEKYPFMKELAFDAIKEAGFSPASVPIRGGTDGARLSFMGVPCPNLGTGGGNYHGEYEYISVEKMEKSVEIIINIVKGTVKRFAKQ